MFRALVISLMLLSLCASGCAHTSPRTRVSRGLMYGGALTLAAGSVTAAGCVDDMGDTGCSGSPADADLAVGVPLMVTGAALLVTGLVLKARKPKPPLPPPVMPDPFVDPINMPPTSTP